MSPPAKLSNEDRRAAIVTAVRQVFAEKGFDGTTTRELAQAAGVSEALLFKHFPDKDALFSAMKTSCCSQQDILRFERLTGLEPSASTLVLMLHFLVSMFVRGHRDREQDRQIQDRLMLRSLAEDGDFARHLLLSLEVNWIAKVEECLRSAESAGDLRPGEVAPRLSAWFSHNLAAMIRLLLLPANPAVDYGVTQDRLVEHAVWFTLRGMGMRDEVIKQHYNAKALALFD